MKNDHSKNWWWRKFLALDKSNRRRAFFAGSEAAAFHYELARRNFPLEQYPAFTKLKRGEHDIAYFKFSRKFAGWKPPVAINQVGKLWLHDGFVSFSSITWNLRASKRALLKTFWEQIETERNQRGVSEPEPSERGKGGKSRNVGNVARTKGKGQPWTWLELMDNPHQVSMAAIVDMVGKEDLAAPGDIADLRGCQKVWENGAKVVNDHDDNHVRHDAPIIAPIPFNEQTVEQWN